MTWLAAPEPSHDQLIINKIVQMKQYITYENIFSFNSQWYHATIVTSSLPPPRVRVPPRCPQGTANLASSGPRCVRNPVSSELVSTLHPPCPLPRGTWSCPLLPLAGPRGCCSGVGVALLSTPNTMDGRDAAFVPAGSSAFGLTVSSPAATGYVAGGSLRYWKGDALGCGLLQGKMYNERLHFVLLF